MKIVLIYGLGRQGLAAFEALRPSLGIAKVFAVDEFWDLKTRNEIKESHKNVECLESLTELRSAYPNLDIDLYMDTSVCLGRIQRLAAVKSWYQVKASFIEKPLFNTKCAFLDGISFEQNTYVNIPRRNWGLYEFLRSLGPITAFDLEATNWGLLCNALHYTDVFSYLNNDFDLRVKAHKLFPIDSRREGFLDARGELVFEDSKGRLLRLSSVKHELHEKLLITLGKKTYVVDEVKGTISDETGKTVFEEEGHKIKSFDFLCDLNNIDTSLSKFPKFSEVLNANVQVIDLLAKYYPKLLGQFT